MALWNGFETEEFLFEGRECRIVFPKKADEGRNFAIKTEYWDAFPATEITLLEKGFHLTYMKNINRWATPEDCHARARFVAYVSKTYNLRDKCVTVGMSCGGAHAVNFAKHHPECVACLYIDAPVLNFCSCPAYIGEEDNLNGAWENEFVQAYPGVTKDALLRFPHHPINGAPVLLAHRIPLVLVYGPNDTVVPYEKNGALLEGAYSRSNVPYRILRRPTDGHHPHGMPDPMDIVEFILANV